MNNNYINRELSWLKFNKRVLEEAQSPFVPDFEKLKFISIFTSNLDEFFMVRAGSMYERSLSNEDNSDNKTGMNALEQLCAIYRDARPLYRLRDVYYSSVIESLKQNGIFSENIKELCTADKKSIKLYYKKELQPLLSPQIIDAKHPLPRLENKKLYMFLSLKRDDKQFWGIVPINSAMKRLYYITSPDKLSYFLAEDILLQQASEIFKSYTLVSKGIIRITRNADIEVDDNFTDDDLDYREYVTAAIKKREKLNPIRLEFYFGLNRGSDKMKKYLQEILNLSESQTFISETPLDMSYVYSLEEKIIPEYGDKPALFYTPLIPQYRRDINPLTSITEEVKKRDLLLSFPYYSIKPYLKLLEEAAFDPETISIKITLYRLSSNSEIINLLCRASENGKEVTAVVELKARFDENNNINWSRRLEEAGCNIVYGVEGLKIHSKITLITRRAEKGIWHLVHIGTGNYNEKTAKIYTDVGIITSDTDICADSVAFFQNITLGDQSYVYKNLLVAPNCLKNRIIDLINAEAELRENGYICIKMNSLTDKEIIDALTSASVFGVKIDLIIRGICCLMPGIAGVSENIKVHSIVGRYLEHSRIFIFGNGENENNKKTESGNIAKSNNSRKVFIGSADLMTRNTSRRIEILTPIYDIKIKNELIEMTKIMLQDNVKRSILCSNGEYEHVITDNAPFDSQIYFYKCAYDQAQ